MRILLTIIIWLIALNCFGQEQRKNTLSLNYGLGYLARQDLVFSPMIHKDFSFLNVGIEYTREAKFFQKVSLRYGIFNPGISTPYNFTNHGESRTAAPHSFNFIDIDYLIGKNVNESQKAKLTVGSLFVIDVQPMNYVYGRIGSFGYYSTIGLGLFGKYQYTFSKKSYLTTILQLPLVGGLARSPYLVNDDEFIENTYSHSGFETFMSFMGDGHLVTWNSLQTFDLDIRYTYALNQKWNLGAAYLFEFIHSNQPRNLLSYRQSILFKTSFIF